MSAKLIFLLMWTCLCSTPSWSASIKLTPMLLEISQEDRIAILKLTNTSDEPLVLQMEVKEWKQENGKDIYAPTKDIIMAPPLAKIGPQERQIVRLSVRNPRPSKEEIGYRLFLNEIPQPSSSSKQGIQTILNISLPLFIKPKGEVSSNPVCSLMRLNKNNITISVLNKGNGHLKVTKVCLLTKKGNKPIVEKEVLDYILPSKEKRWELALPTSFKNGDFIVSIETSQGELTETIQLPSS